MITNAIGPAAGYYGVGSDLTVTVEYDTNVTVTGQPEISLIIGSTNYEAEFSTNIGGNSLVFSYIVQDDVNSSSSGIIIDTNIALNGGTISDTVTNALTNFVAPIATNVIVDTTPPVVTITAGPSVPITNTSGSVSYTVNITDAYLGTVVLTTNFIQPNPSGTATASNIEISPGGGDATSTNFVVTLSGLSGNGTLGFMVDSNAVSDLAGNESLASTNSATFVVDTTAPVVTITAGPSVAITNAGGSVSYTVNITNAHLETVLLTTNFIQLIHSNTAAASSIEISPGGGDATSTNFVVTLSGLSGNGTLGFMVDSNAVSDLAGNESLASTNSATFVVDTTAPVVTIAAGPSAAITNAGGSVSYTVSITNAHLGTVVLPTNFIQLNPSGTAAASIIEISPGGGDATSTNFVVTLSGLSGNGTLGFMVDSNAVSDLAGNESLASTNSAIFVVDTSAPVVTIAAGPSVAITNAGGSVSYTVNIADARLGMVALPTNFIQLIHSNTAAASSIQISPGGGDATSTNFVVTLSGLSGNGTLGFMVDPNAVSDLAGNESLASTNSATFVVDTSAPVVTITAGPSVAITNASGSVSYTVNITNAHLETVLLTTNFIQLIHSNTAAASSIEISPGGGDATSTNFVVTLSGLSGNGTLGFMVDSNAVSDLAGNESLASTNSATFVVDTTAPVVTIAAGPSAAITNAGGSVSYTVNITNAHLGTVALPTNFIQLNPSGTAAASIIEISPGSGDATSTNFVVTLSGLSGNGTLGFMVDSNAVSDLAGNESLASTNSATFMVDTIAPVVTITAGPSVAITNAGGSVSYTVNIADARLGMVALPTNFIQLIHSNTAAASSIQISPGGGDATSTNFVVTLSGLSGNGTLGFMVDPNAVSDLAGNENLASTNSATFVVDTSAPVVTIAAGPSVAITNASGSVSYTVNITNAHLETVLLTTNFIQLIHSNTAAASSIEISPGGGDATSTNFVVTLSGLSGNGTLGFMVDSNAVSDLAGNESLASTNSATFVVDTTAPVVTIAAGPSVAITNASGSVSYTVNITNAHLGTVALPTNFIQLNLSGTAAASIIEISPGSGDATSTNFVVTLSGLSGNGTLGFMVDSNAVSDLAGNESLASTNSNPFRVFTNLPSVTLSGPTIINPGTNSANSASQLIYTVGVSDTYMLYASLSNSDIIQVATGSARATVVTVTNLSATTNQAGFSVVLGGLVGQGSLGFVISNGFAYDVAGNTNAPSTNSTVVPVGAVAPQIVIEGPSPSTTSNGPVSYTIDYHSSNLVSTSLSLGTNGITTNSGGTATGLFILSSNTPTSYTLVMTNITGVGSLGFSVAAGTAVDANGNLAGAAGPSVPVFVLGPKGLAATLSVTNVAAITNAGGLSLTLTLTGVPNATYQVQSTTNLAGSVWQFAGTALMNSNGSGSLIIYGGFDTNVPAQFYRAVFQ